MNKIDWNKAPSWATEVRKVNDSDELLWSNSETYRRIDESMWMYSFDKGTNYTKSNTALAIKKPRNGQHTF